MSSTKTFYAMVFSKYRQVLETAIDSAEDELNIEQIIPKLAMTREGQELLGFFVKGLQAEIFAHPDFYLTSESLELREHTISILKKEF